MNESCPTNDSNSSQDQKDSLNNSSEFYFTKAYHALIDAKISDKAKVLWMYLSSNTSEYRPGQNTILTALGWKSAHTLSKAKKELLARNMITVTTTQSNKNIKDKHILTPIHPRDWKNLEFNNNRSKKQSEDNQPSSAKNAQGENSSALNAQGSSALSAQSSSAENALVKRSRVKEISKTSFSFTPPSDEGDKSKPKVNITKKSLVGAYKQIFQYPNESAETHIESILAKGYTKEETLAACEYWASHRHSKCKGSPSYMDLVRLEAIICQIIRNPQGQNDIEQFSTTNEATNGQPTIDTARNY